MSRVKRPRYYFDAPAYLGNLLRGMTPFTPAMVSILQVEERMKQIKSMGLDRWIKRHADLAGSFRRQLLKSSPEFGLFAQCPSSALTAVTLPDGVSAGAVIAFMRERYDWWFAPATTSRKDQYIRVSHMGNVTRELMGQVALRLFEAVKEVRTGGKLQ
jgi:aspartate aminotransferase-like enzyme